MGSFSRRYLRWAAGAAIAAASLSSCATMANGPLVASDAGEGEVHICAPAYEGAQIYFGFQLTNQGSRDAILDNATIVKSSNSAAGDFFINTSTEHIGAAYYPHNENSGPSIAALIENASEISGYAISPQEIVNVLLTFGPENSDEIAQVNRVDIAYKIEGDSYVAAELITFEVSPKSCSE